MAKRRRTESVNSTGEENMNKLSFIKRKSTLKKKAAELSTLCDVSVCMVCFGPYETVETWPENKSEVLHLISKYRSSSEKAKQKGKQWCDTLTGFSKKRKLNGNSNKGFGAWDQRLDSFSYDQLLDLCNFLNSKLVEIREKIRVLQKKNNEVLINPGPNHVNCGDQNLLMQVPDLSTIKHQYGDFQNMPLLMEAPREDNNDLDTQVYSAFNNGEFDAMGIVGGTQVYSDFNIGPLNAMPMGMVNTQAYSGFNNGALNAMGMFNNQAYSGFNDGAMGSVGFIRPCNHSYSYCHPSGMLGDILQWQ